jgi:hypothetical protein
LDEADLRVVTWVFGNDLLDPATFRHLENVGGLAQIKGHDLMTHVVNHGLLVGGWWGEPACPKEHTEGSKDSQEKATTCNQQEASFVISHGCVLGHYMLPP